MKFFNLSILYSSVVCTIKNWYVYCLDQHRWSGQSSWTSHKNLFVVFPESFTKTQSDLGGFPIGYFDGLISMIMDMIKNNFRNQTNFWLDGHQQYMNFGSIKYHSKIQSIPDRNSSGISWSKEDLWTLKFILNVFLKGKLLSKNI